MGQTGSPTVDCTIIERKLTPEIAMNIKVTWKSAGIFFTALLLSAGLSVLLDNQAFGFGLMIITVYYLNIKEKNKR